MKRLEALQMQRAEAAKRLKQAQEDMRGAERVLARVDEKIEYAGSDAPVQSNKVAVHCNKCGADVSTEARFSAHYEITDWRFDNLGTCPTVT